MEVFLRSKEILQWLLHIDLLLPQLGFTFFEVKYLHEVFGIDFDWLMVITVGLVNSLEES